MSILKYNHDNGKTYVIASGRLTSEPVLKEVNGNRTYAKFNMAVAYTKDEDGNGQTEFLNCCSWNAFAVYVGQFHKNDYLFVMGEEEPYEYEGEQRIKVKCDHIRLQDFVVNEYGTKQKHVRDENEDEDLPF